MVCQFQVTHLLFQFDILSDELERLSLMKVKELINELHELATSTTSLTAYTQTQWPNVTIPYFQEQGDAFRALSHTNLLILSPKVKNVEAWNDYAATHLDWFDDKEFHFEPEAIPLHNGQGDKISSTSTGLFNPIWEISPLPEDFSVVNLDLRAMLAFRHAAEVAEVYNDVVVSEITMDLAADLGVSSLPDVMPDHPYSFVVQPITDTLELDRKVVGYFVSVFTWELFLGDILHTPYPITSVVENDCGDVYTFEIKGEAVSYVGSGDQHHNKYDHLVKHVPFVNFGLDGETEGLSRNRLIDGSKLCTYTLRLYPTPAFENVYMTHAPMLFSVGCIGVFMMTTLAFVCWDWNVRTRQKKLAMRVQKTNKIVSAMFPKSIQAQLLKNGGDIEALQTRSTKQVDYSTLLQESTAAAESNAFETKPVADLYVATTIMFAVSFRCVHVGV